MCRAKMAAFRQFTISIEPTHGPPPRPRRGLGLWGHNTRLADTGCVPLTPRAVTAGMALRFEHPGVPPADLVPRLQVLDQVIVSDCRTNPVANFR